MKLLAFIVVGFFSGCVHVGDLIDGFNCDKQLPPGLTKSQCIKDQKDREIAGCINENEWKKFGTYERCVGFRTDPAVAKCWPKLPNEAEYAQCKKRETDPEEKYCHVHAELFESREQCAEAFANPIAYNCKNEIKENGGSFYDCMRYHEDKAYRQVQQQAQRDLIEYERQSQQEEADREHRKKIGEAIGTAFGGNKTKTKCVSKKGYGGTVETECSH